LILLTSITSGLATLGAPLSATNTITDNDVAAFTVSKAVNQASIAAPSTLTYTITVVNSGNIPLTSPAITDTLSNGGALTLTSGPTLVSGDAAPAGVLDVGETWTYDATYAVTQASIDGGLTITNRATFATTEAPPVTSNTVTTTITRTPQLTIVKTPSTSGPVPASSIITYTYKVTNSGNITMTSVGVSDAHNGSGSFVGPGSEVLTDVAPLGDSTDAIVNGTWDTLGVGDSVTFTATYTVTQQDVDTLQ
jgi:large repetitive protein